MSFTAQARYQTFLTDARCWLLRQLSSLTDLLLCSLKLSEVYI